MPGVSLVPLFPSLVVESTRLPGSMRGDPGDRMIVATARRLDAVLATRDDRILDYAAEGYLTALRA